MLKLDSLPKFVTKLNIYLFPWCMTDPPVSFLVTYRCNHTCSQVHSLTARSLSREYREGLGLKVREKTGHAVQDSDDSDNGSAKSEDANTVGHRHQPQLA